MNFLRAFLHSVFYPPTDCFYKNGRDVIDNEIFRKRRESSDVKALKLTFCKSLKLTFEIAEEKLIVGAGEKLEDMVVVFHKMLKKVKVNRVGSFTGKNVSVGAVSLFRCVKNVAEKLSAKLL